MRPFNLSGWSLKHKQLVYYFVVIIFGGGIIAYPNLGRMEDPDFTVRGMMVSVAWPGSSARQVEEQVTDKIERKLQEVTGLDYLKSYSTPGRSIIYVYLKEDVVTANETRPIWLEVRNMVNDIKDTLPQGVVGPLFYDHYDDVFGNIYALTGDGFTYEELHEKAESIRRSLLRVFSVKKIDLAGVQPEKIYIEIESSKLARLNIDPGIIMHTIQTQNAMSHSGMLETSSDNIYLRVTGMFENMDDLRNVAISAGGRSFRLGDIAKIERSYTDPPEPKMFYNGEPAIGIAVSMEKGGNILDLRKNLNKAIIQIKKELPLGMEISTVFNQPQVVKDSINDFLLHLALAVGIVLLVCFLSLGMRSGSIVALAIPLVMTGVFICMRLFDISLQKISIGALIISLGLLVDDAIVAIEIMTVKLEQGWQRFDAACFAYKSTAYPLLTGTLITCAGFIPVGLSKGAASEMVGSIFFVVAIALTISWLVAATATPLLGYALIKTKPDRDSNHDIYDTRFYRWFKAILIWCLTHRWRVLAVTAASFIISLFLMGLVKQEFFPVSTRPELIVDMRLPQGASFKATEAEARRFSQFFSGDKNVASYSYYVGQGSPRFVLNVEPVPPDTNFVQFVFLARNLESREKLQEKINRLFTTEFSNVCESIKLIQTGPPAPYPVMLRVSGYDHEKVREFAAQIRDVMVADKNLRNINLDWNEKSKTMRLSIDQDRARTLGLDSQMLALNLQSFLSGMPVAEFRERDKTVQIIFRIDAASRTDLSKIKDLNIHVGGGRFIPLDHIAKISLDAEDGLIWRRNLKPTITVQAQTTPDVTGNDATGRVYNNLGKIRESLPPGYSIEIAGNLEDSIRATGWLLKPVPAMILIILTLLMFQFQSISKVILTLLTAPLGIIGAVLGLLITGRPMGFVVQLGLLALGGIIIRNTVVLIDQIDQQIAAGESLWNAVINATVLRFRPIMLTAAAAVLAMVPLANSVFWGPMAVAIGGGLLGATVLTLLVLPVMYVVWYKVQPDGKNI